MSTKISWLKFQPLLILALILAACGGTPEPTQDLNLVQTQAAQTVVAQITLDAPPPPQTPTATATLAPAPGPTADPNIPVAIIPTPEPGQPAAIANYNTVILSGPGQDYVVYSTLLGGKSAVVIGKSQDGKWWAVSVPVAPNGQGWVEGSFVATSNAASVPSLPSPPVPPTTELVPPVAADPQATAIANTYVRSGPGANFPAYGIAQSSDTGRVIGKSEDGLWWVVRLNPENVGAGYGWVSTQFTQAKNVDNIQTIQTPPTPDTVLPPPPPVGAPTVTALEYVNVRSGPGTNYPIYAVAAPGASAEVSGKSSDNQWYQVRIPASYSPEGLGWVSAGFVYAQNTQNVPVVEAPPAPPTTVVTPPPTATQCKLVSQSPVDKTEFAPGTSFNTTWTLQNTSATKWDQNESDIRFFGALDNVILHSGPDVYDLATTVESGWTYTFSVTMVAPIDPGDYGELWQITTGSQPFCQFYVLVTVK